MTRYARAKGSKASNERLPNEATPWHEMKQDLLQNSINRQEKTNTTQKVKSAKDLLREKEEALNAYNNWAEFEETKLKKSNEPRSNLIRECKETVSDVNINLKEDKRLKKRKYEITIPEESNKTDKQCKSKKLKTLSQDVPKEIKNTETKTQILTKRQKRNMKNKLNKESSNSPNISTDDLKQGFNITGNDWDNSVQFGMNNVVNKNNSDNDMKTDNKFVKNPRSITYNSNNFDKPRPFHNQKIRKRKPPKIRDDKEHKRKKPDISLKRVIINGVEVEIVMFDGFPIQKRDAERLKELRQKMIMKGIPKSEVDAAIKLERRKAEKALTRIKKNVCFHCRKSGHNLSDCPELANEQSGTGICFKCGSTEHTHFECKVNKSSEYRYATCFICREQGHIAKQCPDNPKGVYPQGGACKVCGDVTHLKKDCPDLAREKEQSALTVDKITDNMESLDTNTNTCKDKNMENNNSKKIVKF